MRTAPFMVAPTNGGSVTKTNRGEISDQDVLPQVLKAIQLDRSNLPFIMDHQITSKFLPMKIVTPTKPTLPSIVEAFKALIAEIRRQGIHRLTLQTKIIITLINIR